MSKPRTTHAYLTDYKERLSEAFGKYETAVNKDPDDREEGELEDAQSAVQAILGEPTPSALREEDEPGSEPEPEPEPEPQS